jgi:hypothetical protein
VFSKSVCLFVEYESNESRTGSPRIPLSSTGIPTSDGIWRASPLRLNAHLRRLTYLRTESLVFKYLSCPSEERALVAVWSKYGPKFCKQPTAGCRAGEYSVYLVLSMAYML